MKYLRQLLIVAGIYFAGEAVHSFFKLPIPGTVIGMLLLFAALYTNIIKKEALEDVSEFLISHMSFLFVPAGVGLITVLGLVKDRWIEISAVVFISTIVVFITTAFTVKILRVVMK